MDSKWSNCYMNVTAALEDENARQGIMSGAIQEAIDEGLLRIIEVDGVKKLQYSNKLLHALQDKTIQKQAKAKAKENNND